MPTRGDGVRRLRAAGGKQKLGGKYSDRQLTICAKPIFEGRAVIGCSDNEARTECLFHSAFTGGNQFTEYVILQTQLVNKAVCQKRPKLGTVSLKLNKSNFTQFCFYIYMYIILSTMTHLHFLL